MKEVKHLKVEKDMKISDLVGEMSGIGFGASRIAQASEVMKKMFYSRNNEENCKIFLGVAGAMVPGGMKQVILDLLDRTDVLVTTGANLTHDLVEALGDKHFKLGSESAIDDSELHKKGFDRIYNVVMPNKVYEKLEDFFEANWNEFKTCKNIKELLWKIGEVLSKRNENKATASLTTATNLPTSADFDYSSQTKKSILEKCYKQKIPIFCPALADSGIGLMIWGRKAAGKEIFVDAFEDMKEIIDLAWTAKKTGVIYIGGGTPKNFIQQSLQFSKGADFGIQITGDRQELGGSSGAPLKEGISWGKLKPEAKFVDVYCDATIALPLILGSAL